jgi:hypothetical protein
MEDPKMKTKVKHSESKNAWNVVGNSPGGKYKIARVPYLSIEGSDLLTRKEKLEAFKHAEFISFCFNNSNSILEKTDLKNG